MEEGLLGIQTKRDLSDGSYRATSQTYGGSMRKLASRPQPSGAFIAASKPSRASTPHRVRQSESSSQGVEEHVLKCGSPNHISTQCPQRVVGATDKQTTSENDEDVEVYMPTEDMILEAENDLLQQHLEQQDRPMFVLCPVLTMKEVKDSEN